MAFSSNIKSWCRFSLSLVLIFELNEFVIACDCPGAQVQVSGQNFCFEIQRSLSNSTWSNADQTCLSLGGFLAHIDSSSLINNLKPYVQANYQRPLLTGSLLGNAEYRLIALMCPNNSFMSLLNTSIASEIINGNASSSSGSCLFLENTDYKLHYDNCNITFDTLCQIPMDNTQTCGVMMQCSNSTNSSTTTALSTLSTAIFTSTQPTRISQSSSTGASQRIGSSTTTTSRASNVSSTKTSNSVSNNQFATTKATQPNNNSSTASKVSSSNNSSTPRSLSVLSANNNSNVSTTMNSNQSTTTSNANQTTYSTPSNNNNYSSTISSFLSSISTLASNLTTTLPSNSTNWPVNSTNSYPDYDMPSDGCDSGYTKLGKWCLPWWAWLVFGGLLFLVLLILAFCCVFVCVGKRKKKAVASENYEKLSDSGANNEYMGKQVRPSSEPPGSIYDTKAGNDYLAPAPYSAPANNAPVYI